MNTYKRPPKAPRLIDRLEERLRGAFERGVHLLSVAANQYVATTLTVVVVVTIACLATVVAFPFIWTHDVPAWAWVLLGGAVVSGALLVMFFFLLVTDTFEDWCDCDECIGALR